MKIKELKKIELKNDGQEAERFEKVLKTVVNVPKDSLKKTEKGQQKKVRKA